MMKLKLLSMLLCVSMVLLCLAGCGIETPDGDVSLSDDGSTISDTGEETDYDVALAKYDLDETVMTVNGEAVTWEEFFYWTCNIVYNIEYYYGTIPDWSVEADFDLPNSYQQYCMNYVTETVTRYHVVQQYAAEKGVDISQEEQSELDAEWDLLIEEYGGGSEEALIEALSEEYMTPELYKYMLKINYLYMYTCFEATYGENGADLSDEDTLQFAADTDYIRAKHILISTKDSEGEYLSDEEKAEKLLLAQNLLSRLNEAEDLEALFDELMNEHSDDTGLLYFPDGYTFTYEDMAENFEAAAFVLEENGLSEIVETIHGYHIILRLPIDPDGVVEYVSEDEQYTIRYLAAVSRYTDLIEELVSAAEAVMVGEFATLDYNKLFSRG